MYDIIDLLFIDIVWFKDTLLPLSLLVWIIIIITAIVSWYRTIVIIQWWWYFIEVMIESLNQSLIW